MVPLRYCRVRRKRIVSMLIPMAVPPILIFIRLPPADAPRSLLRLPFRHRRYRFQNLIRHLFRPIRSLQKRMHVCTNMASTSSMASLLTRLVQPARFSQSDWYFTTMIFRRKSEPEFTLKRTRALLMYLLERTPVLTSAVHPWSECNYRISKNTDISTVCWQSARGIHPKNLRI